MRPMAEVFIAVLLVGWLVATVAVAGEREGAMEPCEGSYTNRRPTPEELATVLRNHQEWLKDDGRKLNDTRRAHLCQADLREANIQEAILLRANLQGARPGWANLQKADLGRANLQGAVLTATNLQQADLAGANLQGAVLSGADLQEAHLTGADLQRAHLYATNLQGAFLYVANLQGAVYEPNPGKLPNFWTLTDPHKNNLETLVFYNSPAALITLRKAFKEGGMRTQERQLTYAIECTKRLQAWNPWWYKPKQEDTRPWLERLAGKSESLFSYVLFELPSGYGMAPGRTLQVLGFFIVLFAFSYMLAVYPFSPGIQGHGEAGIWMLWLPDRVHKGEGETAPVRVTPTFFFSACQARAARHWWGSIWRGLSTALIGLYFSVLSAFSLGWRELNVSTWIARVQSREYTLRATGWVRTVSGVQSLLSVYLLALWVLTYFGRPFE